MRPIITSTAPPPGFTIGGVADPCFETPRLAALYDPLDPDRADLLAYLGMAGEFCARSVLDIGCGTGTLACVLATLGLEVTGLDPAAASLDIARAKPGGDRVRWVHGDVTALPPLQVDLAVMTGNVAQVFLGDEEWRTVLGAVHGALRPGGRLVFETRDPARRAWEEWDRAHTFGERRARRRDGDGLAGGHAGPRGPGDVPLDRPVRGRRHRADLGLHAAVPVPRGDRGLAAGGRV